MMNLPKYLTLLSSFFILLSCNERISRHRQTGQEYLKDSYTERELDTDFKEYWYDGTAEITSYRLSHMRYGEKREGRAVLIYVKEDFLPDAQIKANESYNENVEVLKLNHTRDFTTGIYPYHLMSSTFYPLQLESHAIKVSASVQEWCGQQYAHLNNRGNFEVMLHSYFEGEADENFSLDKNILENELWTQLRIDPGKLPTGNHQVIPDLNYNRLKHTEFKAYEAQLSLEDSSYTIAYTSLPRKLIINFEPQFPYQITGWEEFYPSGSADTTLQRSTASRIKSLKTAYWQQNSKQYEYLRDTLGL